MFQHLIDQMPPDPSGVVITMVVAMGIGLGALTALLGSLHSRPTMALMMLSIGAVLGYAIPTWLNWNINYSVAIGAAAIIFGLIGFLLHRLCVALALGMLIASISIIITYDQTKPLEHLDTSTPQEQVQVSDTTAGIIHSAWTDATPRFRSLAVWIGIAAFSIASLLGFALPKFGMAVLYSVGGTVLTLFAIKLGHTSDKIHWLDSIKTGPMTIASLGLAMVLLGFLTQTALLYRPESAPRKEPRDIPQEIM